MISAYIGTGTRLNIILVGSCFGLPLCFMGQR